jgi:hypothetical protein
MLPDPFFTGPGLDRADALRAFPERIAALAAHPAARQLVWDNGAPALDEAGRLQWRAVDGELPLFLGLAGEAPRFSQLPPGDGWWQPLDQLAGAGLPTLYRRAQPRQLAPPPRLLLGVRKDHSAQSRRLVARLRRLRRRTLSARRPGRDHARRA